MSIDWGSELDRVEEATRPMSEGAHKFRVVEAKVVTAQTGNRMIKLTVKAEGGPDDGKVGYSNVVFTFDNPRAMKMTIRRLTAFGISEQQLRAEGPSLEQIAAKMMGKLVDGTVKHREWNGVTQDDIEFGVTGTVPGGVPAAPPITGGGGAVPTVPAAPDVAPPVPVIDTPALAPDAPPAPEMPASAVAAVADAAANGSAPAPAATPANDEEAF